MSRHHNLPGSKRDKKRAPLAPDVVEAFLKQATVFHSAGNFADAARMYEHVEAHNPDAMAASYFRALIDVEMGRLEPAAERLERVTRATPESFEAHYRYAVVCQELGRWDRAAEILCKALAIADDPATRFLYANTLEVQGRMDEALAQLRGLAARPGQRARALAIIARLRPQDITAEEQAEMTEAAARDGTPPAMRMGLHFALGGLHEQARDYDAAFTAFAQGNLLRRANLTADIDEAPKPSLVPPSARSRALMPEHAAREHAEMIAFATDTFTRDFLARYQGQGHDSFAPIFIVGMPRSGTTLLEQILSSHRNVLGMGESSTLFETLAGHFPTRGHMDATALPANHFRELGARYLKRQEGRGWKKAPFVVDKMLNNYLNIGQIHLMFPRAKILHSVRDPVETCLGCYRQLFRTGNETTFDLKDIGEHYVRYRAMMAHWETVLPGRVTHVVHEELVADPDAKIRWLIEEVCNLKWDPACLKFYETDRPVRTASIAQVRQPIFKTSLERWRRYEKHLGPLFDALGPYAPVRSP